MPKVHKVISLQNLGNLIFCMKISIKISLKQIPSLLVAIARHAQSTQSNKSLQHLRNISRKKGDMKLIFRMKINRPFCKLILSILVSMTSHSQSTQNNKFGKSFQYLKKEVRDEGDLCTDKHQSIQKVSTIISDGCSRACLKYSK